MQNQTNLQNAADKHGHPLILLVEDNPITRKIVRLALQVEGYRVAEAGDGRAALDSMRADVPDLVLLDLLLPDLHGADLALQLRALPGGADIPIIAFSGFVSKMEELRVAGAGFTDFLLKPVEPSYLIKMVASYLVPRAKVVSASGSGRRLLLVDDDPVQLKLLRMQFEHAGFQVQVAHHGTEALAEALREPPDLIVTDALMPQMDGFDLCLAVRHEPRLRALPLIMISANYLEAADQALGARVGANAFLSRDQGFDVLLRTALASLTQPAPTASASAQEIEIDRHAQLVRQLERQLSLHAASAQRNVVQSMILRELGLIGETLAKRKDLNATLDDILAYCLDGAGLSRGALYLAEADAPLALHAQYGDASLNAAARAFFGVEAIFLRALRDGVTLSLPSDNVSVAQTKIFLGQAKANSALIIPVRSNDNDCAVLALFSLHLDLLEEDWVSFGRALAAQIGQSVVLSRTFFRLADSERRYRSLFEAANDGICVTNDEGIVVDANPAACAMSGYPLDTFCGQDVRQLITGSDRAQWPEVLREYTRTGILNGEFTYLMRNGIQKTVEVHGSRIAPGRYLNVLRDVTERKRAEETIHRLAYLDPLTELPNRTALQERLRESLLEAHAKQQALALLLLNLNSFREINDALGHPIGDQVLQQVATRLQDFLWESDMVARLASDEFAILLPRLSDPEHINLVVSKITAGFKVPFVVAGVPLDIQLSIGVALFPQHGNDADSLFQHADVALHTAKERREAYFIYDAKLDRCDPQQLGLMAELRDAIAQDALTLYCQPKLRLSSDEIVGVEMLVRWQHPKRGFMPPMDFIPMAEKTGVIDELTRWVVKTAMAQATAWREAGMPLTVAINLSARNMQDPDFVDYMKQLFSQTAHTPEQFIFEITESLIMLDPEGAKQKLNALYEYGVRFSIDDFGTGYSSLTYLKELPVSQLKIDKSFVMDIKDTRNAAIVFSTIDLAHNLGLEVTAEGVEDAAALMMLKEQGCDEAQGYYIARPMPMGEMSAWLKKRAG